ncbi:hypothetical protein [Streptomyces yunnanensis]|uniref:Uncharacterized protein n=1 Tax=Streptomyces yunnanensis TaxID=156453 RepID=A0A9X8QYH9_9ACTN|nr:hypothetical protein [Streptomyces yunnanensis]SHN08759.1 hypothetical protein SAMN05216268_119101 [Streptomyces yunnanensis]
MIAASIDNGVGQIADMDLAWTLIRPDRLDVASAGGKVTIWGHHDDGVTVRAQRLQDEAWLAVSMTLTKEGRPARTGLLMRELPDYARLRLNDLVRQLQWRLGKGDFEESPTVRRG